MKLAKAILGILLTFGTWSVCNAEPITALYYVSMPTDWVGQGEANSFIHNKHSIFQNDQISAELLTNNAISVKVQGGEDSWFVLLSAPNGEPLQPGVYKNAQRYPFQEKDHPGLNFSGCGRGHNTLKGEFEVLELEYDPMGNIHSFAVNFIQGNNSPLFGCIRYNSEVPIQKGFLVESYGSP